MENAHIWLITGAVIGMIAHVLDKGRQLTAMTRTLYGLAGGFLGGWLFAAFELLNISGIEGHVVRATAGAGVLLGLARLFTR
jgi:uncharacterized membrane protein YeaQ/YmgE (transglycosylase-associated protein family)